MPWLVGIILIGVPSMLEPSNGDAVDQQPVDERPPELRLPVEPGDGGPVGEVLLPDRGLT